MNLLVAIGLVAGFNSFPAEIHQEFETASANKRVFVRNTLDERVEVRLEGSSIWASIPPRGVWQGRIRTSARSIVVYARAGRQTASARVPFFGDTASCAVMRLQGHLVIIN